MMQNPKKFLFDMDFKNPSEVIAPKPEDIAQAFEEGRAQGERETAARLEAEGHATLKAIRHALEQAVGSLDSEIERVEHEAIRLATELVRVYTAATLSRDPAPLIKALIKKATEAAGNIPTLSIFVGPELTDILRQDIETAIADAGFSGRVALSEDHTMTAGDVRIEWPDGGFKHSRIELDTLVDSMIATHITTREKASA
jgi:flagellar assembly protein FliH